MYKVSCQDSLREKESAAWNPAAQLGRPCPRLPDLKSLGLSHNTGSHAEVICNFSLRSSREGGMS